MNTSDWWPIFDGYVAAINYITLFVAIIIMLSSIDDLFIDISYWVRRIYRALFIHSKHPRLPITQLRLPHEKWMAIMIPAWQEHEVIERMVETTIGNLEYERFMIFIGVYPNDPPTKAAVHRLSRQYRQVIEVNVPHDGPTCKADCLNWIVEAIMSDETTSGREYAGFVMHDSEDVIHPLELRLFNYLIPRKDFIQLPVLSLECHWKDWVACTYMDDFAEHHQKELYLRESLTGLVPGAGVSACYSRRAMQEVIAANPKEPFNTATLTEDYDFSFRMKELGLSQIFVLMPVQFRVKRKTLFGREVECETSSFIAAREYFPDNFRAAFRQRARWIIGIAFQGWQSHGWRGSFWLKYFLLRDRKGLVTAIVASAAYALVLNYFLLWLAMLAVPSLRDHVNLPASPLVLAIMGINMLFFLNRILHRIYFVTRLYGWWHGLLSPVRIVVNNFINIAATVRAWRMFIAHLLTGKRIAWDKTEHTYYPSQEQLLAFRRRLGDVLVEWNAVDRKILDAALKEQADTGRLLGGVLIGKGAITTTVLADAIAHLYHMPRHELDLESLRQSIHQIPRWLIVRHRIVPLGIGNEGALKVGVCSPMSADARTAISSVSTLEVEQYIITESEMNTALRFASTGSTERAGQRDAGSPLLGDLLIQNNVVSPDVLAKVMGDYDPDLHGRLGSYLVNQGVLSEENLEAALRTQSQGSGSKLPEVPNAAFKESII